MQTINSLLSIFYGSRVLKSKHLLLIFGAYLILLVLVVSRHEPWLDEAQPWLLVSDFSLSDLFVKYLRYEGHPSLWYLILFLPAKIGLPYFTINVLAALLAASGVLLFLRYAPFPLMVKILFPFAYFTFFQYGVVARGYCLIPLILFLTAIKYPTKIEHPYLYILLLCLLANISVHTFLMAGTFAFVHFLDVLKIWSRLGNRAKIHQAAAMSLFGLSSLQLVLLLMPPPDQGFAVGTNFSLTNFLSVTERMFAGSLVADDTNQTIWLPIAVSLVVFIATVFFLRQKKLTLLYLLPLFAILGFLAVKYSNLWHEGILFFLWIFVLWVGFERDKAENFSKSRQLVLALLTVVLGTQVYWTAAAAQYDFSHNYSASYDVAEYIKKNQLENRKIYASGWKTVAIAPYFKNKIFYNQNEGTGLRIWFWSTQNQTAVGFDEAIAESIKADQPDVVIFSSDHLDPDVKIELEGYRLAGVFDGNLCWKTGIYESNSYQVFRKSQ